MRPITSKTVLVMIDKKGKVKSVSKIPDEEKIGMFKLREKNDGADAGVSFPSFSIIPDDLKSQRIVEEKIINLWIPKLISAFKKYPELQNFIDLCQVFAKCFDFNQFTKQYGKLVEKFDPTKKVDVFIDFERKTEQGYYVKNTEFWKFLKDVMYVEFPLPSENGTCWFEGKDTILQPPQGMEVLCSKKLFPNGVVLYSKNNVRYTFSNGSKVQISRELYRKVAGAAEWILSDDRYKKNSYRIDVHNSALLCYVNSNPAVNAVWAQLLCELPDAQEGVEDIQKLVRDIMSGGTLTSSPEKLSYFVIKKMNDSGFVVEGEGVVDVSELVISLKRWNSLCVPVFPAYKKLPHHLGLSDLYTIFNRTAHTIDFTELFNDVFLKPVPAKCQYLLTKLIDRHWLEILTQEPKSLSNTNKIALTIGIMSQLTTENTQDFKSIGQLCFVADNLNQLYNELNLKRVSIGDRLSGYEAVRSLNNGQLVLAIEKMMRDVARHCNWAMKLNTGDKVGLVKYYDNHARKLISEVTAVIRRIETENRLLTVNEKTHILLAYVGGINNKDKETSKPNET
jgi:hypothetical protein